MKKLLFSVFFLGIVSIFTAQSQSEDLTNLKKQVTVLKSQTLRLEKKVKEIKTNSNAASESIRLTVKKLEAQLLLTADSLKFYKKMAKANKNTAITAIKSLRHRKTLLIWGAIIALILAGIVSYFVCKKYKSDLKKIENDAIGKIKIIEGELNNIKNDHYLQITSVRDALNQKTTELDKKITDLKKPNS